MPSPTINHEFENPNKDALDWEPAWYDNFEKLDTGVEIRDVEANVGDYAPKEGAKYFSTDTGTTFIGDGDTWSQIGSGGGSVNFESVTSDEIQADTRLTLPIYDDLANAPAIEATVVYSTGATQPKGVYRHNGSEYTRLTGGGGGAGLTGREPPETGTPITGDGTTTEYRIETNAAEPITWGDATAVTEAASADFATDTSGTEIVITYATPPPSGEDLAWFWQAVDPGADDTSGASDLDQLTINTDKNWSGYAIRGASEYGTGGTHTTRVLDSDDVITDTRTAYILLAGANEPTVTISGEVSGHPDSTVGDVVSTGSFHISAVSDNTGTWSTTLREFAPSATGPVPDLVTLTYDTETADYLALELDVGLGERNWDGGVYYTGVADGATDFRTVDPDAISNVTSVTGTGEYRIDGNTIFHENNFDAEGVAGDPHGNEAHTEPYSVDGHNHDGDSLTPTDVSATTASVTNAPVDPTDVARLGDIEGYVSVSGDTMSGSLNLSGYSLNNVASSDIDTLDVGTALTIPAVSGEPDEGSLWFRTDL